MVENTIPLTMQFMMRMNKRGGSLVSKRINRTLRPREISQFVDDLVALPEAIDLDNEE